MFHTDRDEEAGKADGARRVMKSDDGCVRTHCPRKTSSSTQHPSGFAFSVVDWYEICGLAWLPCIDLNYDKQIDSLAPARLAPLGLLFQSNLPRGFAAAGVQSESASYPHSY